MVGERVQAGEQVAEEGAHHLGFADVALLAREGLVHRRAQGSCDSLCSAVVGIDAAVAIAQMVDVLQLERFEFTGNSMMDTHRSVCDQPARHAVARHARIGARGMFTGMKVQITVPVVLGCLAVTLVACAEGGDGGAVAYPLPKGNAALAVEFQSKMSDAYWLEKVDLALDDWVFFHWERHDPNKPYRPRFPPVFTGKVETGEHLLRAIIVYRGNGEGALSYLRGYRFILKSGHNVAARPDKPLRVRLTAYEEGTASTPLDERPRIGWTEEVAGPSDGGTLVDAADR